MSTAQEAREAGGTAEQDLDLYVVFVWLPAPDHRGGKRRCRTGGGGSFCVVHGFTLLSIACRPSIRPSRGRSAAGHPLELFGAPGALHRDLRRGVLDVTEIAGREFD